MRDKEVFCHRRFSFGRRFKNCTAQPSHAWSLIGIHSEIRSSLCVQNVCTHVYTHEYTHVYTHTDTRVDTHIDTHVHAQVCKHVSMHVYTDVQHLYTFGCTHRVFVHSVSTTNHSLGMHQACLSTRVDMRIGVCMSTCIGMCGNQTIAS